MKLKIFIDGASRGNPGPAALGVKILSSDHKVIREISERVPDTTNNQAEYLAFIRALIEAKKLKASDLEIFSDSELLVKQIKGTYKVKDMYLKGLHQIALWLQSEFKNVSLEHIKREKNSSADGLANLALDNPIIIF